MVISNIQLIFVLNHNKMKISNVTVEMYPRRNGTPYRDKNKLFIFVDNESIWENFVNRRCRPHTSYKKEIIPMVMEKLKVKNKKVFKLLKDMKWGWRQNCGCTCGCSPGFVSESIDYQYFDISVSIK